MANRRPVPLLVLGVFGLVLTTATAAQIEVWVATNRHEIEAERRGDEAYYPVRKIAEILQLRLEERGGVLTVEGPRGKLRLVSDRPLVRLGDEYVLLSASVWRKRARDWYVTDDFLTKALPLIVDRRLEQKASGVYELQAMAEIPIRVRLANYDDHVRVVFESSEQIPVQVVEYGEFIEVRFGNHAIQAELPLKQPDGRFVSAVTLGHEGAHRAFRIQKGEDYQSFREFSLEEPLRKVIDVYGRVSADAAPGIPQPLQPPPAASSGSALSSDPDSLLPPALRHHDGIGAITIDPGHGGEEAGVMSPEGLTEKDLNLQIANRIAQRVGTGGHRGMLTRSRDVDLGAEQRSAVGNYNNSNVFLSVHAGGSPSPEPRGAIVYVHKYAEPPPGPERASASQEEALVPWSEGQRKYLSLSRELAQRVQSQLNQLWGVNNQVLELPLGILAPVTAPAVLIEVGFLTNPRDAERLQLQEFREEIAGSIASAVLGFLQDHPEIQISSTNGRASD